MHPISPIKSVVHARQKSDLGRFATEAAAGRAEGRLECGPISRTEIHVISFQKCRPLRREHPFGATADSPACSGVGGLANLKTIEGNVCTGMSPRSTALEIEQPSRCHRIPDATRQGIEPLIIEVNHKWPDPRVDRSTSFVARPIVHVAEAEHPIAGELIIAADLTATGNARAVCGDFDARD